MPTLLSLGEATLRLTPPGDDRLTETDRLRPTVSGASAGVAVAAARLGLDARWVSKLPDSPPAERVTGELARHGVDPVVTRADSGRVGVDFVEHGPEPRGTVTHRDRDGATAAAFGADDLDGDAVAAADLLYVNAADAARSEALSEAIHAALGAADGADTTVTVEVGFNGGRWGSDDGEALRSLLAGADVAVVDERVADAALDRSGNPTSVTHGMVADNDLQAGVLTKADYGATGIADGVQAEQAAVPVDGGHPGGAGAGFVGGLLACLAEGDDLAESLEYGAATAALARTMPGDLPVVSPADVSSVLAGR